MAIAKTVRISKEVGNFPVILFISLNNSNKKKTIIRSILNGKAVPPLFRVRASGRRGKSNESTKIKNPAGFSDPAGFSFECRFVTDGRSSNPVQRI